MQLKINIGQQDGTTTQLDIEQGQALKGLKIGDTFKGELIDKTGYEFEITGGSNKSGLPMRKDVDGDGQRRVLLSGGVGYRPKRRGLRVRKTVAGNAIGENTTQVNAKVIKAGKQGLTETPESQEEPATEE